MAEDGGAAFARLFSQRREDLGLSMVDIAVQTGRPIEVVVGWERGLSAPGLDDLPQVAQALKLPIPLLEEALRRAAQHRRPPDASSQGTEDTGALEISFEDGSAARPDDSSTDAFEPGGRPGAFSFLDAVRTRVLEPLARRRRRARAPAAQPSYLEDRDELITYRLRMVLTAAGVAVLALVLRWSLGGLGSAAADLWEALTAAL